MKIKKINVDIYLYKFCLVFNLVFIYILIWKFGYCEDELINFSFNNVKIFWFIFWLYLRGIIIKLFIVIMIYYYKKNLMI